MIPFRWRLASLWLSQLARVLADNWLRLFIVLALIHFGLSKKEEAWHLILFMWTWPNVLLAPCNGALSNSLPKHLVLIASAILGLIASSMLGLLAAPAGLMEIMPWLIGWQLIAVSFAVYGPTRYALLPAASLDARVSLPRLNAIFELGAAVAVVAGVLLAAEINLEPWHGFFIAALAATFLYAFSVVFALPVRFVSEVSRPEKPAQAVFGFFRDAKRIWHVPEARGCLIGLASLRALVAAFTGAVLADHLSVDGVLPHRLIELGVWLGIGTAAGALIVAWHKHPRRVLGLVPWGAVAFTVGLMLAALHVAIGPGLCLVVGIAFSLVNIPLSATLQAVVPADARGNGMAARNFCEYTLTALLVGSFYVLAHQAGMDAIGQYWTLTILAGIMALLGCRWYFQQVLELALEWLLIPTYRVTIQGPGLEAFPRDGPVLLVANHSAWFDPIWLAKVLDRRFIAMMTSQFYDKPGLNWLFVNVAQAIRVEAAGFRREVPELEQAIAVLDNRGVLLVFPEGSLRKREDRPLRQFGQGIWRILQERPSTPIITCWIEGGWGSFCSYANGPPTKNKRMDIRRPICVGISEPFVLPAEILADQRRTRTYLREQVSQARTHLGLEAVSLEASQNGDAED